MATARGTLDTGDAAPSVSSGEATTSDSSAPIPQNGTPSASASKAATPKTSTQPSDVPERTKESFNKLMIDRYITRDHLQAAALRDSLDRTDQLAKDMRKKYQDYEAVRITHRASFPPSRLFGEGYNGYANGYTDGPFRITYPHQKWSQKPPGKRTTPLKFSRKDTQKQAEQHEELVPVRLDVDWDKVKLRDTFTWNMHERLIQPETFAAQLIEDMGLKPPVDKPVFDQVVNQITEQLNDFYPFAYAEEDALDPELPYSAYKNDEMRILVRLHITIGSHTLIDQFEWDINNPMNSPEEFAASMARDLALSGEFSTAIAHSIREQAQLFTRSLYGIGHPFDGRPIEDPDLLQSFLPSPIPSVFRPQQQAKDYAPYMYELTEADLEKNETIISREQRRQKRSVNRRGGPTLPDLKERPKTIRTLIVSSVLPGAVDDIEESRLFKRIGTATAGGRGKRTAHGDLSDSDESDDSGPDSPAMAQLQGTARTRGLRVAASAAAQRMSTLGRSETPEATIHHHETRTSRRFGRELTKGQSEEPERAIVTLKVNPARLRKLMRDLKMRGPLASGSATPTISNHHHRAASATGSMGPPTTPSAANLNLPPKSATPLQAQIGRASAPPPPPPVSRPFPHNGHDHRPNTVLQPPEWLQSALRDLLRQYPNDSFEGVMRYCYVNAETEQVALEPPPGPGQPLPPNTKYMYLPRIRCHDCPGKLYTPGPETTVGNFEVHLKNRMHREKVDKRLANGTQAGNMASTGSASQAGQPSLASSGGTS
jgi:SWI/SNF-related matrix-associated actin-dependent regulator of chromatin subfamily B protein 1